MYSRVKGISGENYEILTPAETPPKFTIFHKGKVIKSGSFEYG
jgi:hypothetical protein